MGHRNAGQAGLISKRRVSGSRQIETYRMDL